MKIIFTCFCLLLILIPIRVLPFNLTYTLAMPEPHTHYFEVTMDLSGITKDSLDIKMPVWAPGSYMVREYSKNVEGFQASNKKGDKLPFKKVSKQIWRVYNTKNQEINLFYKVYAFELTVRTSFLDADHAYINGTSVFMYVDDHINHPCKLIIKPFKDWKEISTSLDMDKSGKWSRVASDYDILVDSPIEIGNHKIIDFEAEGIKHSLAIFGNGNYDPEKLVMDIKKIISEATKVVGENPSKNYVFIIHNLQSGGGGLEHLNSTTLHTTRWNYESESGYQGFLGLVAHEYFHLWNIKRIRPINLGPFNYEEENYTNLLWFSEGFTSYYDDMIVQRTGLMDQKKYLDIVGTTISGVENMPGSKVQSLAESSFDAWIKYYRPNENSSNSTISYYNKGPVIAVILDLLIMNNSKGEKSIDDVMKYLYQEYYKKSKRGFTDKELIQAFEKFAGESLQSFFSKYVWAVEPVPYDDYLKFAGLKINRNQDANQVFLGAAYSSSGGRTIINSVEKESPAYQSGLNVNDEILSMDQWRVDDLGALLKLKKPGDQVKFLISRAGVIREIPVKLDKSPHSKWRIEKIQNPTQEQEKVYKKWLRIN